MSLCLSALPAFEYNPSKKYTNAYGSGNSDSDEDPQIVVRRGSTASGWRLDCCEDILVYPLVPLQVVDQGGPVANLCVSA